jgi:hypothetical protein
VDNDRLEPVYQRRVRRKALAVFGESGDGNARELAAGQGRLEKAGGDAGAASLARASETAQVVDEENDILGTADFVHDRLVALFKPGPVLGARDHHRQVESDNSVVTERCGGGAAHNQPGHSFDDGRLADAGRTDEERIVPRSPAEDLNDAFDLVLSAHHRVQFGVLRQQCQVEAEAVEGRSL